MDWVDPLGAAMLLADVVSNPLNIGAVMIVSPPAHAGADYIDQLHQMTISGQEPTDPRLRRYPHRGMETGGLWAWKEADQVDLRQHCLRRTLERGEGPKGLWRLVSRLHAEPLDRSRPMWMSYLIDGLDDGRFAVYLKIHHTVVDGVAGLQMITQALSTDPQCRSMPTFFTHSAPPAPSKRSGLRIPNPVWMIRSMLGTAASSLALAERVVTGEAADLMAGLVLDTDVLPLGAPFTRFNGRLGHERTVAAGSWDKSRIRAVQRAAGVTGNDAVTAVVAGVLRRWMLDRHELPERSLVAICPITVRGRNELPGEGDGNRFGAWLCPLGTDLDDPAERLNLIHRSMSEGKHQVANRGSAASMLLLATSIAPTVLFPMLPFVPKARTGYNLPISSVPGPASELYWNGSHVDEIYPVSAVYDGQGLNVTTFSYADHIGIGYVAGSDVVPDIDTLISLTEESLTELEAAVGVGS
ncbi:wax ester/triacylglycerol synthase family O-acyltransferase [Mycobacterium sp. MMS18-G62]